MRSGVVPIVCFFSASLASGLGLTFQSNCTVAGAGFFPFTAPQLAAGVVCGTEYTNDEGGDIEGNATMSATYSSTGVLMNAITDSFSIINGDMFLNGKMTSEFSDVLTILGGTGTAYLTFNFPDLTFANGTCDSGTVLSPASLASSTSIGFICGIASVNAAQISSYGQLQFTYGQPIPLTVDLTDNLNWGGQNPVLNNPFTATKTLTDTETIKMVVTTSPWNFQPLIFEPLPSVTIESALGITYQQISITVAPEPVSGLMFAFVLLLPFGKRLWSARHSQN